MTSLNASCKASLNDFFNANHCNTSLNVSPSTSPTMNAISSLDSSLNASQYTVKHRNMFQTETERGALNKMLCKLLLLVTRVNKPPCESVCVCAS